MNTRKTLIRLLLTTSLTAAAALPAAAQGRTFSEIDTDGNGSLSVAELEAVFGVEGAARVIARDDADGDGMVSRDEVAVSGGGDDDEDDASDESDDDSEDDSEDDSGDDDESGDDDSDESDEDSDDSEDSDSDDSDESDDDEG